jgi:hypothetical protein
MGPQSGASSPPRTREAGEQGGRPLAAAARRDAADEMAAEPERPDVTPLADLLHERSRGGPVREQRPVYVDLLPPCNAGCSAGENIQAWPGPGSSRPALGYL